MSPFHAMVHASAWSARETRRVSLESYGDVAVLEIGPEQLTEPWPIDFMTAFDRLEGLPRMFIELDGAWVWVGESASGERWQLDGLLNDSPQGLMTVELKGTISPQGWQEFRDLLLPREATLVMQLMREGVYVTESEFERLFTLP